MSVKANPLRVGIFALSGAAILGAALFLFGIRSALQPKYQMETYVVGDVEGLSKGSDVKLRGVVVGGGDPWTEADRLATSGDFTQAAHLLYRGLIERLAATEQIRLHPSKTSGDYARELLLRGARAHGEFRQFGRRYDRVLAMPGARVSSAGDTR